MLNRIAAKDLAFAQLTSAGTPFLVAGLAVLAGLLAGSYPALFLSSFQPARVLKGDLALGARGRTFRKILFIGQFSLAVLFLISFTFIREQLVFLRSHDPGFEKERILTLAMGDDTRNRFGALREELLHLPGVLGVTSASNAPTRGWMYSNSLWDWPGKDPRQEILMRGTCADVGYFDLMGIEILQGRDFVEADDAETNIQWIINEEAARIMGLRDPVGKPLTQADFQGTIVGLVKNHHVTSLKDKIDPLVIGYNPPLSRILFAKLRPGDLSGTIRSMEPIWQKFAPRDEFKPQFLSDAMDALYRSEERIEAVLRWFSTLVVMIACLGLFGLATFLAERRTKEIGIRRTLGATTGQILLLFSREFIWGIIAANALAWPAAYLFVRSWLRNYAARIPLSPLPFLSAAALSLLLALATVNIRFIRAARSRPAETLKHE